MYHFHRHRLPSINQLRRPSWGGQGDCESLTLGLKGTNPRFPWQPSAAMLTYRLQGTTEAIGVDHDEPDQSAP